MRDPYFSLFAPVSAEMAKVIEWIRATCEAGSITLRLHRTALMPTPLTGYFSGEDGPEVGLTFRLDCTPQRLWWSFLHELGHMMQWKDFGTDWLTYYTYYMHRLIPLERDAWVRAERLARTSLYPATEDFAVWANTCLQTYYAKEAIAAASYPL